MSPPSMKGLRPVSIPHRTAKQPGMYTMINHPLLEAPNKVYVVLLDVTEKGMREALKYEDAGCIPAGDNADVEALGFFRLVPGDFLFSRDINGMGDAKEDLLQVWVTGRGHFSAIERNALTYARDQCLGPRARRSSAPPKMNASQMYVSGGLPIEQGHDVKSLKPDTRVYTIANSLQRGSHRFSPASGSKMHGGMTENARLQTGLLKASSVLAKRSMEYAPLQVQEELSTHAALVNKPDLGVEGNYAYGTAQLNIAVAKRKSADVEMTELGFYGRIHRDRWDHCAYFTHMLAHSDIPEDYDPGRFFIYGLGIYILLENFTCINFSGLRKHGGQPPTSPGNRAPKAWAYRFVVISYPPEMMMNGQAHSVLAALPNNKVFRIVREMSNVKTNSEVIPSTECTTWAHDGPIVYDTEAHCKHYGRSLLSSTVYFLNQLPIEYDVQLDSDQFLKAISYMENGQRKTLDAWDLGPGWRRESSHEQTLPSEQHPLVSQNDRRESALLRFALFEYRARCHIPYAFLKHKEYTPEQTHTIQESQLGVRGRPALSPLKARKPPKVRQGGSRKKRPRPPESDEDCSGDEGFEDESTGDEDFAGQDTVPAVRRRPITRAAARRDGVGERKGGGGGHGTQLHDSRSSHESDMDVDHVDVRRTFSTTNDTPQSLRESEQSECRHDDIGEMMQIEGSPNNTAHSVTHTHWGTEVIVDVNRPPILLQVNALNVDAAPERHGYCHFLQALSVDALKSEERSLLRTIQALAYNTGHETYDPSRLSAGMRCICATPTADDVFNHMQSVWVGLRTMEGLEAESKLTAVQIRRNIMITNYCAWYWLDTDCVGIARSVLDGEACDDSWIVKLVKMVKEIDISGVLSCDIRPSDIRANFTGPCFQYLRCRRWRISDFHLRIINIVVDVLQVWLGFPSDIYSRQKAQFISVLFEETHRDMLYVETAWHAYNHLRTSVFSGKKVNVQDPSVFEDFRTQIRGHPIHDPTSVERSCLSGIATLMMDVAREGIAGCAVRNRICMAREESVAHIAEYVLELAPLLETTRVPEGLTRLQSFVMEDLDGCLPFPAHTPSHRVGFKSASPFEQEYRLTNSGLASAVIWRGLTFASSFASIEGALFLDKDSWCAALRRHTGQPPEFFINPSAFGRPNRRREVHLGERYWDATESGILPTWPDLTAHELVPFDQCFRFFTSGAPKKRFPQIGLLTAYLLTIDYVYAGVVSAPTVEDIALKICQINRGAIAGLEDLGLIPVVPKKGKPLEADVREASLELFCFLDTHLSQGVKDLIDFGPAMMESTISKYHKAFKLGALTNT